MNNFIKLTALSAVGVCGVSAAQAQAAEQPNVVVILLDDVGYSDFGCYGSEINTPNIDKLAEKGVRLRHFYNQARSGPTRASLMTGVYPHQVGNGALGAHKGYENYQGYPNEESIFIPEVLSSAGYFSIMTGKWHLGFDQGSTPVSRGFDRSLNAPVGGFYFSTDKEDNGKKKLFMNGERISFTDSRLPKNWYSTDIWTQYGLNFVDEALAEDKPFFWYLAYNGAHFPLQAPAKTIAKYKGKYMDGFEQIRNARYERQLEMGLFDEDERLTPRNPKAPDWDSLTQEQKEKFDTQMAVYAAVIEEIDNGIGEVVSHLEKKGVLDNTLIILLSDNGGNGEPGMEGKCVGKKPGAVGSSVWIGASWADVANTPYFMYKHHGHEGGCNTPFIISYPNGMDKSLCGSIDKNNYGHLVDIMATLTEVSGATYPQKNNNGYNLKPMEGVSLLPILQGESVAENRPVIVEHEGNKMLRIGDWKVVQEYSATKWSLYNIKNDPTEMTDLAKREPKRLKEMVEAYEAEADRIGVESEIKFKIGKWYSPIEDYMK